MPKHLLRRLNSEDCSEGKCYGGCIHCSMVLEGQTRIGKDLAGNTTTDANFATSHQCHLPFFLCMYMNMFAGSTLFYTATCIKSNAFYPLPLPHSRGPIDSCCSRPRIGLQSCLAPAS